MKKIGLFISIAMLLVQFAIPGQIHAQVGGCPGFSPTTIKNSDNTVTFGVNNMSPNKQYDVVIDLGTLGGTGIGNPSTRATNSGGNLSATFTRANGDGIFAVEPDNSNDVYVKGTDGTTICKSTYRVSSACQIDFTGDDPGGPKNISTNTNITVTGDSLPIAPRLGEVQFIRVSGPVTKDFNINIDANKKFTTSIGKLTTMGSYTVSVYRAKQDILVNITGGGERVASCPQQVINVGAPGSPAPNPVGPGVGGFGPGGKPDVSCKGLNTNIDTAIGCIPVNTTQDFVAWGLGWFVGIAGGIAFLLMVWGGFQIMTASGNPDQVKGGQEILTAAISGLILIIFSVFLLKLIGVQIFNIPWLI